MARFGRRFPPSTRLSNPRFFGVTGDLAGVAYIAFAGTRVASPATASDDNSNGGVRTWSSPTSIFSSNNTYAGVTGTGGLKLSGYLRATNFSPGLPSGTIVDRIKVRIEKYALSLDGVTEDAEVKLIVNGSIVGNNKAIAGNWSAVEGYVEYDYTTAEWGVSTSSDDWNLSNSGVVLSINIDGDVDSAFVDHIELTYYAALVTGTLTGTGALLGTAALTFTAGSSALTGAGALAGTSALIFGEGSSVLTAGGDIVGTSLLVFAAGASALTASGDLVGTSALIFGSGSSFLSGGGDTAGTTTLAFGSGLSNLTGVGALASVAVLTFGAGSSTLTGGGTLAGNTTLTFGAGSSELSSTALFGVASMTFTASLTVPTQPVVFDGVFDVIDEAYYVSRVISESYVTCNVLNESYEAD